MKHIFKYLMFAFIICVGCEELPKPQAPTISNVTVSYITDSSARFTFSVSPAAAVKKVGIKYHDNNYSQEKEVSTADISGGNITLNLEGLSTDRQYYYTIYIQDALMASISSSEASFRTTPATVTPSLSVSTSRINASPMAGNYTFTIMSNTSWTVTSDQSWCTVQPGSGNGDREVTVSVTANTVTVPRTANLTVMSTGTSSKQITVEQEEKMTVGLNASEFGNGIVASTSFGGGNGTESFPYLISTAQQLKKLVNDVNGGNKYGNVYFNLNTDINVTADEWIPIGTSSKFFSGSFDGSGHTVSGTMKSSKYNKFGFFGDVEAGKVFNLTITANVRNEYNYGYLSTGAIAGENYSGIIRDCHITGNVFGGDPGNWGSSTGGVVGDSYGSIQDCSFSGNVTMGNQIGPYESGGGEHYATSIGGIAGWNSSTITNCIVSGTITEGLICDDGCHVGGIAGVNSGKDALITNCTVTVSCRIINVKNPNLAGGITGLNHCGWGIEDTFPYPSRIINCTNQGTVSGGGYSGGLAGYNIGEIHSSLNTGSISGKSGLTGGLVGANDNDGHIYSCNTNRGTVNNQPASESNQIGEGRAVEQCTEGHTKR